MEYDENNEDGQNVNIINEMGENYYHDVFNEDADSIDSDDDDNSMMVRTKERIKLWWTMQAKGQNKWQQIMKQTRLHGLRMIFLTMLNSKMTVQMSHMMMSRMNKMNDSKDEEPGATNDVAIVNDALKEGDDPTDRATHRYNLRSAIGAINVNMDSHINRYEREFQYMQASVKEIRKELGARKQTELNVNDQCVYIYCQCHNDVNCKG